MLRPFGLLRRIGMYVEALLRAVRGITKIRYITVPKKVNAIIVERTSCLALDDARTISIPTTTRVLYPKATRLIYVSKIYEEE